MKVRFKIREYKGKNNLLSDKIKKAHTLTSGAFSFKQ